MLKTETSMRKVEGFVIAKTMSSERWASHPTEPLQGSTGQHQVLLSPLGENNTL